MPSNTKHEFSNPFADVDIQPISVAGETVPTRVAVRVKDDASNYALAGIVGKDYQLLPNRKVRDITEDIMARSPKELGGFKNIKTLFDGKRYVDYFASNNPIASMNGNITDRTSLMLGLMAWNAYDGTRKTGFEIFALNPWCTNQYHSRNRFGFFAFRHTPGEANAIDVDDALQNISIAAQNVIRVAPLIGELRKAPLELPYIWQAKGEVKIPTSRWGDVLDRLGEEAGSHEGSVNRYDLFQALTYITSHKLSGLSSIDSGSSVTDFFLPKQGGNVTHHTSAQSVLGEREHDDEE